MKYLLLPVLAVLMFVSAHAQYTDTVYQYFDGNWKKVEDPKKKPFFYFRVAKKTKDGKWHVRDYYRDVRKLQSEGICLDDSMTIQDGKWYYYYYNGQLSKECSYYKGTPVGLSRSYSIDGRLIDSTRYRHNGIKFHKSFHWDDSGRLIFYGEYDMKGKGTGYETVYYDDSTVSAFGKYATGYVKDSLWSYYRVDGTLSFTEMYDSGKLVSYQCYDEQEQPIADCDTADHMPDPGYDVYWYLGEHIKFPKEPKGNGFVGSSMVQVRFTVDVDGSIGDLSLGLGSYDYFNKEALRVVRQMPKWHPGWSKNRNVKAYYTLPVIFRIE